MFELREKCTGRSKIQGLGDLCWRQGDFFAKSRRILYKLGELVYEPIPLQKLFNLKYKLTDCAWFCPNFSDNTSITEPSIFCPDFKNISMPKINIPSISRISVIFTNPVDEISFVWAHVVSFTFLIKIHLFCVWFSDQCLAFRQCLTHLKKTWKCVWQKLSHIKRSLSSRSRLYFLCT